MICLAYFSNLAHLQAFFQTRSLTGTLFLNSAGFLHENLLGSPRFLERNTERLLLKSNWWHHVFSPLLLLALETLAVRHPTYFLNGNLLPMELCAVKVGNAPCHFGARGHGHDAVALCPRASGTGDHLCSKDLQKPRTTMKRILTLKYHFATLALQLNPQGL